MHLVSPLSVRHSFHVHFAAAVDRQEDTTGKKMTNLSTLRPRSFLSSKNYNVVFVTRASSERKHHTYVPLSGRGTLKYTSAHNNKRKRNPFHASQSSRNAATCEFGGTRHGKHS